MVGYATETPAPKKPREIIEAAKQKGRRQVIEELFKSRVWQENLYPGISSANKEWLEVAVFLKPEADAGASEEINDALSLALLKRPDRVLPILKEMWWQNSEVCYFGWDSEFPDMTVRSYVNQLEKALKNTSGRGTAALKNACLRGIAKTRRELDEHKQ